jgi:hypothetical protein
MEDRKVHMKKQDGDEVKEGSGVWSGGGRAKERERRGGGGARAGEKGAPARHKKKRLRNQA